MARGRFGINGTSINKIFDGMCVKTIVLINPIFVARGTASNAEIPASTFAPKKILPSVPESTPNFTWNQYAIMLCTTNPPANASSAKRALNLKTTLLLRNTCRRPFQEKRFLIQAITKENKNCALIFNFYGKKSITID